MIEHFNIGWLTLCLLNNIRRNPDLVWRDEPTEKAAIMKSLEEGDDSAAERGWVIIIDRGSMHQLNLLAGEIWLLMDGALDEEGVAKELAAQYDAPLAEILEDVRDFVGTCKANGWLG